MSVEELAVLGMRLNYAQCWEDIDVLREALSVKEGERVLSICSAGDNSFAFCLRPPGIIVGVLSW